jgi:hypothetical protein
MPERNPRSRRGVVGDESHTRHGSRVLQCGQGYQGKEIPGQTSALYPHIQPGVNRAGENLEAATHANAKIQATLLGESSTVIKGLVKDGEAEGCGGVL